MNIKQLATLLAPILALVAVVATSTHALAHAGHDHSHDQGPPPMAMPPMPSPADVKLTKPDVEKLIKVLPQIAKESAKHRDKAPTPGLNVPADPEALERLQGILAKEDMNMVDFSMKMMALVSAYLALTPEELEKNLPTSDNAQIKALLADPNVPAEQKQVIRQQAAMADQNRDALKAQIVAMASDHNKNVVKGMLPRVKKALEEAERIGKGHGTKAR